MPLGGHVYDDLIRFSIFVEVHLVTISAGFSSSNQTIGFREDILSFLYS